MDTQNDSINAEYAALETEIDKVASAITRDDNGKYQLPEGDYSPEFRIAAMKERRRRDTQGTLTKTTTKLKAAQAVKGKLAESIVTKPILNLSPDEQQRLDDLKHLDPEAWRSEMNTLEQKAIATRKEELDTYDTEASQQAELEARVDILADFNRRHPDAQFTDELLDNELPARYWNSLKKGKVSFEQFLEDAYTYIKTPKKVADNTTSKEPEFGKAAGDSAPSKTAMNKQNAINYETVTF